jgi:twitching motility protein PilJ
MSNGLHTNKNNGKNGYQPSSLNTSLKADDINQFSGQKVYPLKNGASNPKSVKKTLGQRFSNLTLSRKQLIALIASELLSILGIGIVTRYLITTNLQALSLEQAKSEVEITDITYNIKINQMGFGFRGQSDNPAIIQAASLHNTNQTVAPELKSEIKQILLNEIKARKIEYATLVGRDLKIIVNANANREGEIFNPDNLVSEVFKNSQQIKATRIVSWSELSKESPPLPNNVKNTDALIRYTITPVKDPNTQIVVGALISGDIVNGKEQIVRGTLKATGDGYSAVYLRKPTGAFSLVKSLDGNQPNLELPPEGKSLLAAAAVAEGRAVTARLKIGDRTYSMAAKAVPNRIIETFDGALNIYGDQPIGILVRGTPETALNKLLENSFWIELATLLLACGLVSLSALILRRTIIKPIQELGQTANKFTAGDRSARSEVFANDEVGKLAIAFNKMADTITQQAIRQENEDKITPIINEITSCFRGSLNTSHILNVAVINIRKALQADRVIVYRFNESWEGTIIAESVDANWPTVIGIQIADPCFAKDYASKYQRGRILALENIHKAGLTECHRNQLEQFGVQANLVAPILINSKLYGLLIAHQCSSPRKWQDFEINLLKQVAIPVGYALEQASLLEKVDTAISRAEFTTSEQLQHNEALQQQILKLLKDIQGAAQGDLTVRSGVTFGELGTVAEFVNSIVESLRELVIKVKVSADQVNTAIGYNEAAIRQLTDKALQQAKDINLTSARVSNMTIAMQTLAENAEQAAQVAHNASLTAQKSEEAMDLTVQNISTLRLTIGDTGKKVKRLGEASQQISHVISLISQIATQTNLLAINAGLEAARAGEGGEALAVISEEIGTLSVHCADATQEIEQILEEIRRETSEVVKAMEQGTTQVVEGSRMVEDAKVSLHQMLDVAHQIDALVHSISQVTLSQVETSQAVSNLMEEISQTSEFTSTASRWISDSLQQTVDISQELQEAVETFKVN